MFSENYLQLCIIFFIFLSVLYFPFALSIANKDNQISKFTTLKENQINNFTNFKDNQISNFTKLKENQISKFTKLKDKKQKIYNNTIEFNTKIRKSNLIHKRSKRDLLIRSYEMAKMLNTEDDFNLTRIPQLINADFMPLKKYINENHFNKQIKNESEQIKFVCELSHKMINQQFNHFAKDKKNNSTDINKNNSTDNNTNNSTEDNVYNNISNFTDNSTEDNVSNNFTNGKNVLFGVPRFSNSVGSYFIKYFYKKYLVDILKLLFGCEINTRTTSLNELTIKETKKIIRDKMDNVTIIKNNLTLNNERLMNVIMKIYEDIEEEDEIKTYMQNPLTKTVWNHTVEMIERKIQLSYPELNINSTENVDEITE